MYTFITGLLILFFGYIFYSKYIARQFEPSDAETPAIKHKDGVDYMPLGKIRNSMIQLLNIAGMGPILGAIQGILFGPVAFIIIPLGCIFMGSVHDYFAGMLSVRNDGMQITGLIKKYIGNVAFKISIIVVAIMLLLVTSVFVYTSGDVIAERFFHQSDFSITNPIMTGIYIVIASYFILATLFPIDKIIGKIYPYFCGLLLVGTGFVFAGLFVHGVDLSELNFSNLNLNPNNLPLIPFFFMTVSCGMLSGFHSTQATIISRTLSSEYDSKRVFYGMMCVESLIAMIWAAGAMHVYANNLVPQDLIGTAHVINTIADTFVPIVYIVTAAVVILPITSGDTALRGLRMIIADALKLPQKQIENRLLIIIPISMLMFGILIWSKVHSGSFGLVWRYFTFFNQLITIPTFICGTVFLHRAGKNFFITLLPGLFYVFITMSFIFHEKIGFGLPLYVAEIIGFVLTIATFIWIIKLCSKAE